MKALITGSRGFVGGYLRKELEASGYEVIGLDITEDQDTIQADLLNAKQVSNAIASVQPDVVFHLAGQASVAQSWKIPQKTVEVNVIGTINLMEAVRTVIAEIPMVLIGSSDEYGQLGAAGVSVSEEMELRPQTPYAVSKKAQEEIAQVYVQAHGMHICMTRSFNHGGPGQRTGFLIPDFASGIVAVERGEKDRLLVGNLSARRDFTHVRDVVRAYRLIAERGTPGTVYNVGAGKTYSAQEILDQLSAMAECPIPVEQDPSKMRPSDTPVICCDHSRLTRDTGWEPEISMETILQETLEEWRKTYKVWQDKE